MNEKNVAIVDAAFVHPSLSEPLEKSHELITILRQQGRKLVFLGNETSNAGADYQMSMARLGFPMEESDQFMSGATFLANGAKKVLEADHKAFLFENGHTALSQEFSELGVVASSDLESDPQAQCRVYIGDLVDFTYKDALKLLEKLDKPSTDLLMAFCSKRIDHQRSTTLMLMNALRGQGQFLERKLWSGQLEDFHPEIVSDSGFMRTDEDRPDQHICAITFDAEIYAAAKKIGARFTNRDNPLFYIKQEDGLHDRYTISSSVHDSDKVSNLDAVMQKLQEM